MPHPIPDPHLDGLLTAMPRPWAPPANDGRMPHEPPLAPARGVLAGCAASLAFLALALVLAWLWR